MRNNNYVILKCPIIIKDDIKIKLRIYNDIDKLRKYVNSIKNGKIFSTIKLLTRGNINRDVFKYYNEWQILIHDYVFKDSFFSSAELHLQFGDYSIEKVYPVSLQNFYYDYTIQHISDLMSYKKDDIFVTVNLACHGLIKIL